MQFKDLDQVQSLDSKGMIHVVGGHGGEEHESEDPEKGNGIGTTQRLCAKDRSENERGVCDLEASMGFTNRGQFAQYLRTQA